MADWRRPDEPPCDYEPVLVTVEEDCGEGQMKSRRVTIAQLETDGRWFSDDDGLVTVIAWMPLPYMFIGEIDG